MLNSLILFAQGIAFSPSKAAPSSKAYSWSLRDMILLISVSVIMASLLFLWAYFGRRNRRHQYGSYSRALYKSEKGSSGSGSGRSRHRHHRRRRPNHPDNMPRNPTLAEAGGLPPLRPEEPSQPAQ